MASDTDLHTVIHLRPGCEWLTDWAHNIYSQFGEDGLVDGIISKIGLGQELDWAVEVGAGDGITNSNTRRLLKRGWDCVLIECDDETFMHLKHNTRDYPTAYVEHRTVTIAGPDSVDAILDEWGVPEHPDLMSLDIDGDGVEAAIWNGLRRRPEVMICEVLHERDTSKLVESVALAKGYTVIARTPVNMIFVLNDRVDALANGSPGGAP